MFSKFVTASFDQALVSLVDTMVISCTAGVVRHLQYIAGGQTRTAFEIQEYSLLVIKRNSCSSFLANHQSSLAFSLDEFVA